MGPYWFVVSVILTLFSRLFAQFSSECEQNPVVKIPDGEIKGICSKTEGKNITYFAFRGIPYAEPPIGKLRFEPPVKNKKWKQTLDASKEGNFCTQGTDSVKGSEDCLFLNVYTPALTKKGLPVMVWIHGGSFVNGNVNYESAAPDYLMDAEIIFVSINYRLGIFGFISTQDKIAPGNVALKDQVFTLKWVQRNIQYFGGDPAKVTVSGQSAGAGAVSYLLLSPLSKDLFRGATMQSGSSLCLWALSRTSVRFAFEVGQQLNLDTADSANLLKGLKNVSNVELQRVASKVGYEIFLENVLTGIPTAPVIEPDHPGAFLSKKSHQLFKSGIYFKVPTIIGFNSNESMAIASGDYSQFGNWSSNFQNVSILTPADLTMLPIKREHAGTFIKNRYSRRYKQLFQFINDDQFLRPIREQAHQTAKYAPVYFYKFSYEGILSGVTNRSGKGVGHAEDLSYIFRQFRKYPIPRDDKVTRSRMVKLWTNFVKHGNPTPTEDDLLQNVKWYQTSSLKNKMVYLDINKHLSLQKNPHESNMKFYDQIYTAFGHPPYDTY